MAIVDIPVTSNQVFSKDDLFSILCANGYSNSRNTFLADFQLLLKKNLVQRVGRNAYCAASQSKSTYSHNYSDLSIAVANRIKEAHPFLDFTIFETVQLNEFINHQIGRNTLFVNTNLSTADYVFDTLQEVYPGQVLLHPSLEIYHQYRQENTIVLSNLISEAPLLKTDTWKVSVEKLLVDLIADPILIDSIYEQELPAIFEGFFEKYLVDESKLFRYAKRRHAYDKIVNFIADKTTISLRTI